MIRQSKLTLQFVLGLWQYESDTGTRRESEFAGASDARTGSPHRSLFRAEHGMLHHGRKMSSPVVKRLTETLQILVVDRLTLQCQIPVVFQARLAAAKGSAAGKRVA
jgi:hypothetical protein